MSPPVGVPLSDTEGLQLGDVVQIAVQLTDKQTGQPFWWKRFACVVSLELVAQRSGFQTGPNKPIRRRQFGAVTLKLHPDPDKDWRKISLEDPANVVTYLPPESWPQGVVAMRMKLIALGTIEIGET